MSRPFAHIKPIIVVPEGHVCVPSNRVLAALITLDGMVMMLREEASIRQLNGDTDRAVELRNRAQEAYRRAQELRLAHDEDIKRQVIQQAEWDAEDALDKEAA